MKNLIATLVTATAIAGITGTACAGDATFKASFNYDASTPTAQTYSAFTSGAQDMCAAEAVRAGYRATESSSWQQRKCVKEIVAQAVKATKSESLIAFHKSDGASLADTSKFASKK